MKFRYLFICVAAIVLLAWLNRAHAGGDTTTYGGLTAIAWVSIVLGLLSIAFVAVLSDSARSIRFFRPGANVGVDAQPVRTLNRAELDELKLTKYRGPKYPHPVIFPDRCIGCQACVDACPHDVLAIVDGYAAAVAPDLCMEDTACQAECPVNPKACIVINTTKQVRSLPAPVRDGSTFQTNVPGCYIIGDVSGVPLIKNAVKEGYEVIAKIADELRSSPEESKAVFDVAVVGIGPGGASAAATAKDLNLKYVAIEQDTALASIRMYPKGKYIFFKPDTKDWFGGIQVTGLGITRSGPVGEDSDPIPEPLRSEIDPIAHHAAAELHDELIAKIPSPLRSEASPMLLETLREKIRQHIREFLKSKGPGEELQLFRQHFLPNKDSLVATFRANVADQLQTKVPGDQRENILAVWLGNLADKGVQINENESCKAVTRAGDGDYFYVDTEVGNEKTPRRYAARRVVIAIGLRGAPNKLRLPNEDMKITLDGGPQPKVLYSLSNPADYRGKRIVVVGGGNSAVESAVDLAANRVGTSVVPRPPEQRNEVTLLVRDYLAPTVKFGNKFLMYHCSDQGMLDVRFGVAIKEMRENELVLEDVETKQVVGTLPNDLVFALIGGERPDRFLKSIGIEIA
jgi:thioredoxin reductase